MTDNTEEKLEELRANQESGNRLQAESPKAKKQLVDHVVDAFDEIEEGEISENITAYDPTLAALLEAIERHGSLEPVFESLEEAYAKESGLDSASKGAIVRLAVRVGLQELDDDLLAAVSDAKVRRVERTV